MEQVFHLSPDVCLQRWSLTSTPIESNTKVFAPLREHAFSHAHLCRNKTKSKKKSSHRKHFRHEIPDSNFGASNGLAYKRRLQPAPRWDHIVWFPCAHVNMNQSYGGQSSLPRTCFCMMYDDFVCCDFPCLPLPPHFPFLSLPLSHPKILDSALSSSDPSIASRMVSTHMFRVWSPPRQQPLPLVRISSARITSQRGPLSSRCLEEL
jgi:hypothetical protein